MGTVIATMSAVAVANVEALQCFGADMSRVKR